MFWRPERCAVKLDSGSQERLGGRLRATALGACPGTGSLAHWWTPGRGPSPRPWTDVSCFPGFLIKPFCPSTVAMGWKAPILQGKVATKLAGTLRLIKANFSSAQHGVSQGRRRSNQETPIHDSIGRAVRAEFSRDSLARAFLQFAGREFVTKSWSESARSRADSKRRAGLRAIALVITASSSAGNRDRVPRRLRL